MSRRRRHARRAITVARRVRRAGVPLWAALHCVAPVAATCPRRPLGPLWVDPSRIRFPFVADEWPLRVLAWPGLLLDGDWDVANGEHQPFRLQQMNELFVDGRHWRETTRGRQMVDELTKWGQTRFTGCRSEAEIDAYFASLSGLKASIERDGVQVQSPVASNVHVRVDREGDLLKCGEGTHRLAIALALGIDRVPVFVDLVHRRYYDRNVARPGTPPMQALRAWVVETSAPDEPRAARAIRAPEQTHPFFSVVVPVHNKADYVDTALRSILAQTFVDFELIVIDDASTDVSAERIAAFDDPRLRVLRRDERGPGGYAARNLGIEHARADWIAFLDADDAWEPHHLETLHGLIERHSQAGMAMAGQRKIDGDRSETRAVAAECCLGPDEAIAAYAEWDLIHMSGLAVRRAAFERAGDFPAGRCRRGGDAETWLRLLLAGVHLACAPAVTSRWNVAQGGIVSDAKAVEGEHPVVCRVRETLPAVEGRTRRRALRRLANRKALGWLLDRRLAGHSIAGALCRLYWRALTPTQWARVAVLLLPAPATRALKATWDRRSARDSG